MFENYEKYLKVIQDNLDEKFKKQAPYIACKKGCSLCCEKGEYPFSEMEFKYIQKGYLELNENLKRTIKEKIDKTKEEKKNFNADGAFLYECPFLINGVCSVYNYRGLICRNFGLLVQREGKKPTIPFCAGLGLSYSSVYDTEKRSITPEKYAESGIKIQPLIFNVSYDFLTGDAFAKGYGFEFGDKKPLIDWF